MYSSDPNEKSNSKLELVGTQSNSMLQASNVGAPETTSNNASPGLELSVFKKTEAALLMVESTIPVLIITPLPKAIFELPE